MTEPSREEFRGLARKHRVVPVWRELLADLVTPVAVFARLVPDDEPGFLLESVEHGERWSRWSFVGRHPLAMICANTQDTATGGEGAALYVSSSC